MGSILPRRMHGYAHADKVAIAKLFEAKINARDYDGVALLVAEDVAMLDTMSSPISGRDSFIRSLKAIFFDHPTLQANFDEFVRRSDGLLVTGRLSFGPVRQDIASLWRIEFSGPLISTIQSFRADNAYSLSQVARGAGIASS